MLEMDLDLVRDRLIKSANNKHTRPVIAGGVHELLELIRYASVGIAIEKVVNKRYPKKNYEDDLHKMQYRAYEAPAYLWMEIDNQLVEGVKRNG
jgi:hypothetical protein